MNIDSVKKSYFKDELLEKHNSIVDFFADYTFGSSMPILSYLSYLKPIDRCIILEKLFELTNVSNIWILDKLVLAYVKVGRIDYAKGIIQYARMNGESINDIMGLASKLDVGIPEEYGDSNRLNNLISFKSQTQNENEIIFLNLLINFIDPKPSNFI